MAVDVTLASECYKANRETLLKNMLIGGKSDPMFRKMYGVKSSDFLHNLETEVQLGACCDDDCNRDDTTHTFEDREIKVTCISVNDKVCTEEFNRMYLEAEIVTAAGNSEFGEAGTVIANGFATAVAIANEKLKWQGDTASADPSLNRFDGILKILANETDVVKQTIAMADIVADPIGALNTLESYLSDEALARGENTAEGALPFIALPSDIYRMITRALSTETLASCCKFEEAEWNGIRGFRWNTTGVLILSLQALKGTNRIVEGSMYNLWMATDLAGSDELIDGFYDRVCDVWRQKAKYKLGVQINNPDEWVLVTVTTA